MADSKKYGYSELKTVPFRNLAKEYYQAEIYMSRRNTFLILSSPELRLPLRNGCNA